MKFILSEDTVVVSVFVVVSKFCNTRRAAEEVELVVLAEDELLVVLFRFMVLFPEDEPLLESVDVPYPDDELSEGRHDLGAGNKVPI
jgi:hypothetical protein